MTESDLALTLFLGLGLPFAFAVIWHSLVHRYLLASLASGVTTGAMYLTYYSWRSQFAPLELLAFFAVGAAFGFIFAAGVGIPFNRRRAGQAS